MGVTTDKPHKVVIELELTTRGGNALYRLMNRGDVQADLSDTLEEALLLHDALQGAVDNGAEVVCRQVDGDETVVPVVSPDRVPDYLN